MCVSASCADSVNSGPYSAFILTHNLHIVMYIHINTMNACESWLHQMHCIVYFHIFDNDLR